MSKSNKKNKKKTSTAKTNVKQQVKQEEVSVEQTEQIASGEEVVVADNNSEQTVKENAVEVKKDKQDKKKDKEKDKKKKKANNQNGEKKTVGQKSRALFSELKKVTWPTFGEACKQTGVVLLIVLIFSVILLGVNLLLGWLFGLIVD